jgi:hypothetical protein
MSQHCSTSSVNGIVATNCTCTYTVNGTTTTVPC